MLEVTVTLVPFGNRARAKTLGVLQIVNDGTGVPEGNYDVRRDDAETATACWKGRVEGWDRRRSFRQLVAAALAHPDIAG